MTTSIKTNNSQLQLRKVAILVATLGEPLGEQLLADLPAREEAAVRCLLDELEEIDPAEHRAVLADFQAGLAAPELPETTPPEHTSPVRTRTDGVELDPSLLARMETYDAPSVAPPPMQTPNPWQALSDADAETLVEMLSAEQPQTVAVVLSRLETPQAAELLTRLAPSLQAEVLTRLTDLDPADEQTLHVVATQLSEWLTAHHQRHRRMAAGRDLVQRILQDAPENQQVALLKQLGKQNPALANQLSAKPRSREAVRPPRETKQPYQPREIPTALQPARKIAGESLDPSGELEALDDQSLLAALQQAERKTVMLALAGVGEELMKRIVRGLPRRQANQFRQQVRAIGPTRLSEISAAQRTLVQLGLASQTQ